MRLPRRVPWSSLAELDQVCAWIYTDENNIDTKMLAIQRLSAWRAITTLPHALESTLAILTAIVQDSSSSTSSLHLHLRQSYASAIIRFVNGFVDPLQLGAYARSIASIAAQLQLPAWLVELRHAATHEDLPSLEVLREASRDAMGWLLNNYFLPSINPSIPSRTQQPTMRPIAPHLKQYKALLKATTRDASLHSRYKPDIAKVLRDIERWIAEAKVAANVSTAMLEWGPDNDGPDGEEEGREQWALERLCEALLDKGGLVPTSRKKRAVISSTFTPPSSMLAIWSPLIRHIQTLHPSFPSVLTAKIVAHLTKHAPRADEHTDDTITFDAADASLDISYDMCAASWANWLVRTFGSARDDGDDGARLHRDDVVIQLANDLGPTNRQSASTDARAARLLLDTLCDGQAYLQQISLLLDPVTPGLSSQWGANDMDTMEQRLNTLIYSHSVDTPTTSRMVDSQVRQLENGPRLPEGWRSISVSEGWKPTPIGV